jgi:hypothetical protein
MDVEEELASVKLANEQLRKDVRNAKAREKRAKSTCKTLLEELHSKELLNTELQIKLEAYKGKGLKILSSLNLSNSLELTKRVLHCES